ncbi:CDP-alcohol phosphatidyltransferase family protein [Chloroflexi bacterium TSY]|nr:CDP-alcohol phosphatidyltransferase family protein [Chloroflexi bacterium TSY]
MLNKYARWIIAEPMRWLAQRLHAAKVTPNTITLFGFILTVLSSVIIATGSLISGGLLLLIASAGDMLDGVLARLTRPSKFGAFLDSTLDRYSESITFFGLAYFYSTQTNARTELTLIFFIIVGSLMVSYTRARAEGLSIECNVGWLQRPERVMLLIIGLLTNWVFPISTLTFVLWILAIFTNFTALQRIYEVYWRTTQAQVSAPPQEET